MTTWIATNFGGNFSRPDIDLHPDILGPGGETRLVVVGERPMTAEEQTMVMQGTAIIYVYGEIQYWDIFNEKHVTKFRRVTRLTAGQLEGSDGALHLYNEEGNDAD